MITLSILIVIALICAFVGCLMGLFSLGGLLVSLVIGVLTVFLAPRAKCPAETFSFPALLPMIPGMYAYRTIEAILLCLTNQEEQAFNHYFYLLSYNGLTCTFIILGMVVGATLPIFLFKNTSFKATR